MQRRLKRFQEKRMVIDDQEMQWLHHASLHGEAARTSSSVPALIRPRISPSRNMLRLIYYSLNLSSKIPVFIG